MWYRSRGNDEHIFYDLVEADCLLRQAELSS